MFEALLKLKKIILQGEYLGRHKNTYQSGFYISAILKLSKGLDFGYRYEYLKNGLFKHSIVANLYKGKNVRFRFQYNIDNTRYINENRKNINEFIIELTLDRSFNF